MADRLANETIGGEGGIRTPGTVTRTPHFECGAFNHSATSPWRRAHAGRRYVANHRRRNKSEADEVTAAVSADLLRASTCAPNPSFPACPGGVAQPRTALATNRAVAAAYDPGAV